MRDDDDTEFEQLLRQALHEHASQILPSGDGLSRIQDRVAKRRRAVWVRPAMAALAAAAAAVAIIALPSIFDDPKGGGGDTASPHRSSAVGPSPKTTSVPTLAAPRPAVWPYGTVEEAAQATTGKPVAAQTLATDLVTAFAGTGDPGSSPLKLSTAMSGSADSAQVQVRRVDTGVPVCSVHVVRVHHSKSYVVTGATSPGVRITSDGILPAGTSEPVKLSGTVGADAAGIVWVDVRKPGDRRPLTFTTTSAPNHAWALQLTPKQRWPRRAVVAAWTVDEEGRVVSFAAKPAGIQTGPAAAPLPRSTTPSVSSPNR